MAAGDVINFGPSSVADDAYLALQPSEGVECVVHNICCAGAAELYFYDGANEIKVDTIVGASMWAGMFLHCTNAKYYRVKNVSGVSAYFSADGMVTK